MQGREVKRKLQDDMQNYCNKRESGDVRLSGKCEPSLLRLRHYL